VKTSPKATKPFGATGSQTAQSVLLFSLFCEKLAHTFLYVKHRCTAALESILSFLTAGARTLDDSVCPKLVYVDSSTVNISRPLRRESIFDVLCMCVCDCVLYVKKKIKKKKKRTA
jgi:hypothetical protein